MNLVISKKAGGATFAIFISFEGLGGFCCAFVSVRFAILIVHEILVLAKCIGFF